MIALKAPDGASLGGSATRVLCTGSCGDALHQFASFPKAQNSPNALYSTVLGPKSPKI